MAALEAVLSRAPEVAVLGPGQSDKTILADADTVQHPGGCWTMFTLCHGELWNGAELPGSLSVNQTSCLRLIGLLARHDLHRSR